MFAPIESDSEDDEDFGQANQRAAVSAPWEGLQWGVGGTAEIGVTLFCFSPLFSPCILGFESAVEQVSSSSGCILVKEKLTLTNKHLNAFCLFLSLTELARKRTPLPYQVVAY